MTPLRKLFFILSCPALGHDANKKFNSAYMPESEITESFYHIELKTGKRNKIKFSNKQMKY